MCNKCKYKRATGTIDQFDTFTFPAIKHDMRYLAHVLLLFG